MKIKNKSCVIILLFGILAGHARPVMTTTWIAWTAPRVTPAPLSYGVYINGFIRQTVTTTVTAIAAVSGSTVYVRANYRSGVSGPSNEIKI
jgi:hypothetical protein